ncbi:hypothetical protein RSOLAG1IB_09892 [Rhizoctonia solani AG-1 IB]|uniref:Uncharacterized protein n=1 Tax=Thanatephorus cucumeris (strain AG1-IB / isolate 7/3/14) TaxID=1108050 RepID=A0A0B7FU88_THACB|nr:hypothetical protein RSOLAG1IB_09892 [Rhizoctonia solani AG-1 IB]
MERVIGELATTSSLLREALDRYHTACSAIRRTCVANGLAEQLPPELPIRVSEEIEQLAAYELILHDAKSAINFARNSGSFTSINVLPREIISYIFSLVVADEHCGLKQKRTSGRACTHTVLSKYPDILTHVCSYWRQIALGSHALWTHIDLSFDNSISAQLVSRADTYASRAGQASLHLHIHSEPPMQNYPLGGNPLTPRLIESLAPQTGELVLRLEKDHDTMGVILEAFLRNCTPGVFTRFSLKTFLTETRSCNFIRTKGNLDPEGSLHEEDLILDLPEQRLDDVMVHVTALHTFDLLLPWSSKAYHNLTDLRLNCNTLPHGGEISESDFVRILRSSPLLQRLELGLTMIKALPVTTQIDPVILDYIRVLKLDMRESPSSNQFRLGCLLRWISPGSRPLRVEINEKCMDWDIGGAKALLGDKLFSCFFSRSNVVWVTVNSLWTVAEAVNLIEVVPSIQALTLENFHFRPPFELDSEAYFIPQSCRSLDTLYLLRSIVIVTDLIDLIRAYKIQRILL